MNQKAYIGCTVRELGIRFEEHKDLARQGGGYALHAAMRKYGVENFKVEAIYFSSSLEEMYRTEIECIAKFNTLYPNGYNVHIGGLGGDNISHNPRKKEIFEERSLKYPSPKGSKHPRYIPVSRRIAQSYFKSYYNKSLHSVAELQKSYGLSSDVTSRLHKEYNVPTGSRLSRLQANKKLYRSLSAALREGWSYAKIQSCFGLELSIIDSARKAIIGGRKPRQRKEKKASQKHFDIELKLEEAAALYIEGIGTPTLAKRFKLGEDRLRYFLEKRGLLRHDRSEINAISARKTRIQKSTQG